MELRKPETGRPRVRRMWGYLLVFALLWGCVSSQAVYAESVDEDVVGLGKAVNLLAIDNEQNLQDAIDAAGTSDTVVTLESDITLTKALRIPPGKTITLRGNHTLIGANGFATIAVSGSLTIDGVTVSHTQGGSGDGITVAADRSLRMISGSVSNNSAANSYGVNLASAAEFIMEGGEIAYNNSPSDGGGVFIANAGYFALWGGSIHHNSDTAGNGGGVTVSREATFVLDGGAVSDNSAQNGGGIWSAPGGVVNVLSGTVSNNAAAADGGGIFTTEHTGLSVSQGAIFSGNKASEARLLTHMDTTSFAIYQSKVSGSVWTTPLPLGYNNYDINYTTAPTTTVTYDYNYPDAPAPLIIRIPFQSRYGDVHISKPARPGFSFLEWSLDSSRNTSPSDDMLIESPLVVHALWESIASPGQQPDAPVDPNPPLPNPPEPGETPLPKTSDDTGIIITITTFPLCIGGMLVMLSLQREERRRTLTRKQ